MKISQKNPKKIGACGGLPGAAPQTPLTGGTPRESTPVAPGGPSTPQGPEAVLSSGARRRTWANFDRRHSSPRARSDKMLTVRKLRLVERKRLPCEPAAGRLGVDCRGDFYGHLCS